MENFDLEYDSDFTLLAERKAKRVSFAKSTFVREFTDPVHPQEYYNNGIQYTNCDKNKNSPLKNSQDDSLNRNLYQMNYLPSHKRSSTINDEWKKLRSLEHLDPIEQSMDITLDMSLPNNPNTVFENGCDDSGKENNGMDLQVENPFKNKSTTTNFSASNATNENKTGITVIKAPLIEINFATSNNTNNQTPTKSPSHCSMSLVDDMSQIATLSSQKEKENSKLINISMTPSNHSLYNQKSMQDVKKSVLNTQNISHKALQLPNNKSSDGNMINGHHQSYDSSAMVIDNSVFNTPKPQNKSSVIPKVSFSNQKTIFGKDNSQHKTTSSVIKLKSIIKQSSYIDYQVEIKKPEQTVTYNNVHEKSMIYDMSIEEDEEKDDAIECNDHPSIKKSITDIKTDADINKTALTENDASLIASQQIPLIAMSMDEPNMKIDNLTFNNQGQELSLMDMSCETTTHQQNQSSFNVVKESDKIEELPRQPPEQENEIEIQTTELLQNIVQNLNDCSNENEKDMGPGIERDDEDMSSFERIERSILLDQNSEVSNHSDSAVSFDKESFINSIIASYQNKFRPNEDAMVNIIMQNTLNSKTSKLLEKLCCEFDSNYHKFMSEKIVLWILKQPNLLIKFDEENDVSFYQMHLQYVEQFYQQIKNHKQQENDAEKKESEANKQTLQNFYKSQRKNNMELFHTEVLAIKGIRAKYNKLITGIKNEIMVRKSKIQEVKLALTTKQKLYLDTCKRLHDKKREITKEANKRVDILISKLSTIHSNIMNQKQTQNLIENGNMNMANDTENDHLTPIKIYEKNILWKYKSLQILEDAINSHNQPVVKLDFFLNHERTHLFSIFCSPKTTKLNNPEDITLATLFQNDFLVQNVEINVLIKGTAGWKERCYLTFSWDYFNMAFNAQIKPMFKSTLQIKTILSRLQLLLSFRAKLHSILKQVACENLTVFSDKNIFRILLENNKFCENAIYFDIKFDTMCLLKEPFSVYKLCIQMTPQSFESLDSTSVSPVLIYGTNQDSKINEHIEKCKISCVDRYWEFILEITNIFSQHPYK